eukprot:4060486-Pyramimonas_sp.AAC.1
MREAGGVADGQSAHSIGAPAQGERRLQAHCPCELLPPPVGEGAVDDFACLARPGGRAQSLGH